MLSDTTWVSYLLLFKNDFTFSTSFYIHRRFYFRSCFIKDMCSIISIQLHKSEVSLMLNQSIPLAFLRTNIVIFLSFIDLFFFFLVFIFPKHNSVLVVQCFSKCLCPMDFYFTLVKIF